MTKGQQAAIFAIERNMNKLSFDVGIRCMYIARRDVYHKHTTKGAEMMLKSYNNDVLNGFEKVNKTNYADDPWQDITGNVQEKLKAHMLFKYKTRTFFYPKIRESIHLPKVLEHFYPMHGPKPFVLSTEELATLFHFPGRVSETPTFRRLESRKAEPPQNLPM